jgi:hypothetical protein
MGCYSPQAEELPAHCPVPRPAVQQEKTLAHPLNPKNPRLWAVGFAALGRTLFVGRIYAPDRGGRIM